MTKKIVLLILTSFLILPCVFSVAVEQQAAEPLVVAGKSIMTTGQAVVLGIVEGLTEYLPVSSTGHLLLAEQLMGIGLEPGQSAEQQESIKEAVDAYTICIQAGAILAVLWLYFGRVKQALRGLTGNDPAGRRLLINIIAGFMPAAVLGLAFNKLIKSYLFGPWPVVTAWFLGGVAILLVSWYKKSHKQAGGAGRLLDDMHWKMALIIGFAQCIAMWPGVSRSLVTIVGGVLVGLSLEAAVEYSFLLGVVTLGAATAYDTLKHGQLMLQTFDHFSLFIGIVVAFIAAAISVKWMVSYLSRHGLEIFGYYRVLLALGTLAFLLTT